MYGCGVLYLCLLCVVSLMCILYVCFVAMYFICLILLCDSRIILSNIETYCDAGCLMENLPCHENLFWILIVSSNTTELSIAVISCLWCPLHVPICFVFHLSTIVVCQFYHPIKQRTVLCCWMHEKLFGLLI